MVVPSKIWRWCTRNFKVTPIYTFYRGLHSHIYQYMEIDYGEVHRMKPTKPDYATILYQLIDYKIGRDECLRLIMEAGLPRSVRDWSIRATFQ